jgi:hypothetical protein
MVQMARTRYHLIKANPSSHQRLCQRFWKKRAFILDSNAGGPTSVSAGGTQLSATWFTIFKRDVGFSRDFDERESPSSAPSGAISTGYGDVFSGLPP